MTISDEDPYVKPVKAEDAIRALADNEYEYTGLCKGDIDTDKFHFRNGKGDGVTLSINPRNNNVVSLDLRS